MVTLLLFPGNYQQALQCYKQIHRKFPESVDCLKFLVKLCSDLGLKESQEYSLKLKKAEKMLETKRQVCTCMYHTGYVILMHSVHSQFFPLVW